MQSAFYTFSELSRAAAFISTFQISYSQYGDCCGCKNGLAKTNLQVSKKRVLHLHDFHYVSNYAIDLVLVQIALMTEWFKIPLHQNIQKLKQQQNMTHQLVEGHP